MKLTIEHRDELGAFLNSVGLIGEGAEIGVSNGDFSLKIMEKWEGRRFYMVDPWRHQDEGVYRDAWNLSDEAFDKVRLEAAAKVAKFGERVRLIRASSLDFNLTVPEKFFDFVYLDGNHSFEACWTDAMAWWPKIKHGGLLCGHDFYDDTENVARWSEVKKAVKKFAREILGIHIEQDDSGQTKLTDCTSWFIAKP